MFVLFVLSLCLRPSSLSQGLAQLASVLPLCSLVLSLLNLFFDNSLRFWHTLETLLFRDSEHRNLAISEEFWKVLLQELFNEFDDAKLCLCFPSGVGIEFTEILDLKNYNISY